MSDPVSLHSGRLLRLVLGARNCSDQVCVCVGLWTCQGVLPTAATFYNTPQTGRRVGRVAGLHTQRTPDRSRTRTEREFRSWLLAWYMGSLAHFPYTVVSAVYSCTGLGWRMPTV